MKILAVSDVSSRSLESLVERSPRALKDIGMIVSCGDLDREYLEFLAEGLGKELFFVSGNHPGEQTSGDSVTERIVENIRNCGENILNYIAGRGDLHGRVEAYRSFLVAGFGGSRWYNGGENQFTEKQMARIVRRIERKIRWYRLHDRLLRRPPRDVIVVSHAPLAGVHDQPDPCHTGFRCFREMVRRIAPLLWIHGHIHLPDTRQNQTSILGSATVVNAYGCKVIDIGPKEIRVYSPHVLHRG